MSEVVKISGLNPQFHEWHAVRNARVVIASDNTVIKDRDGVAGRAATNAEISEAVAA